MSVKWSVVLVQHPAKHAASAVRSGTELPTGAKPTRGSTNTPTARAPDARTAQTQRGSQSTGRLYSPSSPRVHVPLATAHTATSPNAHKASRSASHTEERSSATRRDELRRKLTTASEPPKPRRRAREPRATPQHQAIAHAVAHADTVVSPRGSSTQHGKAPPRKARVYCGQNKLDPSLRVNGGTLEVGTRSRCFRAGFGGALHQHIDDEAEFVRKFTAPYAPLIAQKLWYKDGPPPEGGGYQPATLSQARLRGWGAGSAALARKLQKKLHEGSAGAARTRSASTRSASPSQ